MQAMYLRVFTFASINIDEVYTVPHITRPGEEISSTRREKHAGGKGANASVAAVRAGAQVHMAGLIGRDGLWVRDILEKTGVNVDEVKVLEDTSTGRAVIQVDKQGENAIFLYQEDAQRAFSQCIKGDWLLLTNETTAVSDAIEYAHSQEMQILWNPAPMHSNMMAAKKLMDLVDVLVLNKTELTELAKQIDSINVDSFYNDVLGLARQIMTHVHSRVIIVTLGSDGSVGLVRRPQVNAHSILVSSESASTPTNATTEESDILEIRLECAPVPKEMIKDTTAAGDTWIGYFIAELARAQSNSPESIGSLATLTPAMVNQAMQIATYASGITVTRMGAIPSIPERAEAEAFFKSQKLQPS
ncbi:Ribokinase-like protein [Coemansia spiralis]|nr:Ribokinase-like protein [Coemansia spiralis]